MTKTKNTEKNQAALESQPVTNGKTNETPSYVVLREGFRVSDKVYTSQTDSDAVTEQEFWGRVATNHSYGEPVTIVQYDSKKHRIW